jgi:hypothetical protein
LCNNNDNKNNNNIIVTLLFEVFNIKSASDIVFILTYSTGAVIDLFFF